MQALIFGLVAAAVCAVLRLAFIRWRKTWVTLESREAPRVIGRQAAHDLTPRPDMRQ